MNAEQLEECKEQMKNLATSLVKGVLSELKEELKREQQSSLSAIQTQFMDAVAKVSKKVDSLEKTLSASSFANRVFDESCPSPEHLLPSNVTACTTVSVVSTTASLPVSTNTSMGVPNSTLVSALANACSVPTSSSTCSNQVYGKAGYRLNAPPQFEVPTITAHTLEFNPAVGSTAHPSSLAHAHHTRYGDQILRSPISPAHSSHLVCSLVPFDGSVSWSDYRIQFEIIARNNQWSEQETADAMISQLRGNALSILSVFPRGQRIRYGELVSLLEQRFGVDPYSCQVQFHGRTQSAKESFANFALELQRLAISAFPSCPTDVVDRMVALRFLEGLRDDELKTAVKIRGPKTLSEAISAAQELAVGLGTGRGARIYMAQTQPSPKPRRRRRTSVRGNQSVECDAQRPLNAPVRPPALYSSFIPESHNNPSPSTSSNSGNLSPSSLRGMSR